MPSVLITGANRGLGLEFTRQFIGMGWTVHACLREQSTGKALAELAAMEPKRLALHSADLSSPHSIDALAMEMAGTPIDILVNNAGVMDARPADFSEKNRKRIQVLGSLDYVAWSEVFHTNVIGTTRLTEAMLPNLGIGSLRKIVMISSIMGSIEACSPTRFPPGGGLYFYRSTKAALNMVARNMAADLADRQFVVFAVNPGWVKTEMGGSDAPFEPATSVSNMIKVITEAGPPDNGSFISHDGTRLPW